MSTRLHAIVVEALDPERQARFWAQALRWRPVRAADTGAMGAPTVIVRPDGPGGFGLWFVKAGTPKSAKNRLHLDLAPGPDQARQVDRVLALGAAHCDIGQGDVPWVVLADPEGNEFCVLAEAVPNKAAPTNAVPARAAGAGELAGICLDAGDPDVQGRFWADATGWAIVQQTEWVVRLRALDGGPSLVMGPPAAGKQDTNRLRPLLVPEPDSTVRIEAERLRAAGARQLDGMLADAEGNEFHLAEP
jgi:predicted enzyme related to lactoylglutathione lyase